MRPIYLVVYPSLNSMISPPARRAGLGGATFETSLPKSLAEGLQDRLARNAPLVRRSGWFHPKQR